ncbi:MAG: hypothetical protein ACI39U_02730 [Candidatus Cryptobacteroides sp.]
MDCKICSETSFSLDGFVRIMDENHPRLQPDLNRIVETLPKDTTITSVCYEYSTKDEKNLPVTMSSLMLIMRSEGQFKAENLWLDNRATQSADRNVPTHKWNIGEVHVLQSGVLVSPDLMGFGASLDRPVCYLCGELAARNTVDAVIAAQIILKERHLTESPLPVLNSGHSQGAFDALAVHRYMETVATAEEKRLFPLVRTWCADGPYMPDVVNEVACGWEKYLYGAYSVMNIMSHINYHPECFGKNVTVADFLTGDGLKTGIIEAIESKEVGNKDLVKIVVEAVGTRLSNLFKEEAYRPGGRLSRMLESCSKAERQTDGWIPSLPISFYHVHDDECVPVETMLELQRLWGHLPNVTFEDDMTPIDEVPDRMVHAFSGGEFHRRLLSGSL